MSPALVSVLRSDWLTRAKPKGPDDKPYRVRRHAPPPPGPTGDCKINASFSCLTWLPAEAALASLSSQRVFPPLPPDFNVERRENLVRPAQKRAFILQRSRPLLRPTLRSGVRGAGLVAGHARDGRNTRRPPHSARRPTRAFILQSPVPSTTLPHSLSSLPPSSPMPCATLRSGGGGGGCAADTRTHTPQGPRRSHGPVLPGYRVRRVRRTQGRSPTVRFTTDMRNPYSPSTHGTRTSEAYFVRKNDRRTPFKPFSGGGGSFSGP